MRTCARNRVSATNFILYDCEMLVIPFSFAHELSDKHNQTGGEKKKQQSQNEHVLPASKAV